MICWWSHVGRRLLETSLLARTTREDLPRHLDRDRSSKLLHYSLVVVTPLSWDAGFEPRSLLRFLVRLTEMMLPADGALATSRLLPRAVAQPTSSSEHGGRPGGCPPPSPRLACCLRQLRRATREAGLEDAFDVTFGITYHGPWLQTPASEP